MNKLLYIAISFILLFTGIINAQQIKTISKTEAITEVSSQNTLLKISEQEYLQAKADYRQTNAIFLPNITASHSGISTTNPIMAFGSKLNQAIITTADFEPSLLNQPDAITNFTTKIEFQQPLINLDGIYQRKAAKNKMNAVALKINRTQDYLAFEVEKTYMQLQLAYKAVSVIEKTLKATLENKRVATNKFKQGYLQKADILTVDVRVTEVKNQLQSAKSNIKNVSDYLALLINEKDAVIFKPTDSLTFSSFSINNNDFISENRADIKAMELASTAYLNMYKSDKMAFLPRLNAFGSYELYDAQIFQTGANGYLIGVELSWNLFEGSKRFGKAQKSKAKFEQSKLEYDQYVSESTLEFKKAKRMLLDADNKLNLTKLAMEQSKEALRIRTNRFKEGLEKVSDLLLSETLFAQKQLAYYQTIFEYNYAQAYLQFLTK